MSTTMNSNMTKTTTTNAPGRATKPRTLTPYSCFQKDKSQRELVKKDLGDSANFGAIAKALAVRWKAMTPTEKAPYESQATSAKKEEVVAEEKKVVEKKAEAKKVAAKQRTRARSAYNFFMQDPSVRKAINTESPSADFGSISKLIGIKWKALSAAEKKPYQEKSDAERAEVQANKPPKVKGGAKKRTRARTAYTLYTIDPEVRGEAKVANPGAKMVELTKILAKQWKALSEETKAKYHEASQQEKEAAAAAIVEQQGGVKKPRRARNPYNFYLMDKVVRKTIEAENPNAKFGEVSKLVGAKWKAMSDAEKAPYVAKSDAEKAEAVKVTVPKATKAKSTRIRSAYTRYVSDPVVRKAMNTKYPEAEFGEMSKHIGAAWKKMTAAEKKPYTDAVEEERAEVAASQPPKKPKRAKSAYLRYSLDTKIRDAAKAANPGASVAELAKVLGAQWNSLGASTKKPYVDAYEVEKASLASA